MKLRLQDDSVRLRLTRPEVAAIGRGEAVRASATFPNGEVFSYALVVTAGREVTARFEDDCVEVAVPRAIAAHWADGEEVGITAEQPSTHGAFRILIEKDFTCLHPRAGESQAESFPNPRATT